MQLSLLNQDQVVANAAAAIQSAAAQGGFIIDMEEGSAMLAMVEADAGTYLWLQWLIVLTLTAARLSTSENSDCDTFGADYGFIRLQGAGSSGGAIFSRFTTTSAAIIPVGTIVKTTDGTQSFSVLADTTNAAWAGTNSTYPNGYFVIPSGTASVTLQVQNTVVGVRGNIIAGAIGLVASAITGIDTVTNAEPFTNGLNTESDTAFKARFGLFLASLARGTAIALQSAALSVQQNITCAVLNLVTVIGGPPAPGYAVLAIDDGSGATPSATINAVAAVAASDSIIPLGSIVSVVQATVVWATVELTITCASAPIKALTQVIVQAAINAYIAGLGVASVVQSGQPPNNVLAYSRIIQLAYDASPNVLNVSAVTLNGGTSDIGGTPGYVVRSSSTTIN